MTLQVPVVAVVLSGILFVSCETVPSRTSAPPQVSIPDPVPRPDTTEAVSQVRKVEEKVDDVEDAVTVISNKLDEAQITATAIEEAVSEAYENGIEAGSAAAAELRGFIENLKGDLVVARKARDNALTVLADTKKELEVTVQANKVLDESIRKMSEQNTDLYDKLTEANEKLAQAATIAEERDRALLDKGKMETKLAEARKYKTGVWIGIIIVVLYVALRVAVKLGAWTPQGKLATTLLR